MRRPDRWALLALALLAAGGTVALHLLNGLVLEAREAQYFQAYAVCRSVVDCVSAVCGVGLLLGDWGATYSPLGRWILTGLSVAGAAIYVAAFAAALRRIGTSSLAFRIPTTGAVLGALLAWVVFATAVVAIVGQVTGAPGRWGERVQTGLHVSVGSALGNEAVQTALPGTIAGLAWGAALGWPLWMLALPHVFRRCIAPRALLGYAGLHAVLLIGGALFATAVAQRVRYAPVLETQPKPGVFARAMTQLTDAALQNGAGRTVLRAPTDDTTAPGVFAVRVPLALLGGLGFGPTGGVGVVFVLWGFAALWTNGRRPAEASREFARWTHTALSAATGYAVLVCVGALGFLLIDAVVATGYVAPPNLGAALQDAAAAVTGNAATTPLVGRLTDASLTGGIGLPIDVFWIGMVWLVVLMLAGRIWLLRAMALHGDERAA